ncbi:MAG: hypothetical protein P8I38_10080 [Arenicella sp.]|jgi:hypothetical protein|nr:hypothetical protein [Arenicella sp.]HAU67058.1 hypothetical protein [Gammaproteobacteria bacterium]
MQLLRFIILSIAIAALTACQTRTSEEAWPNDIPSRTYFKQAGIQHIGAESPNLQRKLNTYLLWIKRFYQGSIIYPLGWTEMSERLAMSMEQPDQQTEVRERMYELGRKISLVWAHDDPNRKITSANVAAWGSALRTAVDVNQQLSFIEAVERDVEDLLSGKLDSKVVRRDRYYPSEEFDDF